MENFVCRDCKFKFSARSPKSCPYCAGNSIEREKSASEIIEEINEES
jgi:rubrerythrin